MSANPYDRTDPTHRDVWDEGHAAAQAEVAAAQSDALALREACDLGNRRLGYWCDLHGSLAEDREALTAMQAALSRPTGTDALRALLERAVSEGYDAGMAYFYPDHQSMTINFGKMQTERAAIVSRLLGEDKP